MMYVDVITTYCEDGETFKIVKCNDGKIAGINTKEIDANGRIKRELRGYEVHISDTVDECIKSIHTELLKKMYEEQGYDVWASIVLAHGGTVDEALDASKKMQELLAQA